MTADAKIEIEVRYQATSGFGPSSFTSQSVVVHGLGSEMYQSDIGIDLM